VNLIFHPCRGKEERGQLCPIGPSVRDSKRKVGVIGKVPPVKKIA
jgi:hypothetical protein